jgi:hypothetical protein
MTAPLTPESLAVVEFYREEDGLTSFQEERLVRLLAAAEAAAIARDREGLVEACICGHPLVHHDPLGRCHGTYGITQMYCSCQAFRTPEQARRILALDAPGAQAGECSRCPHPKASHDTGWDAAWCMAARCSCNHFEAQADDGRFTSTIPLRPYSERTGR